MKIIVFDDNPADRKYLTDVINSWCRKSNHKDLIIRQFDQIQDLEFALSDLLLADVFFLDIMTPESTNAGFLLAERIHTENPAANIVFTTNSSEY